MDKNNFLLSLYSGRSINKIAFEKYFSPNGSDAFEYTHEILGEWDYVSYELIASIENNQVTSVDVSKVEDYCPGHGRPTSIEKKLTAAEWKYAYKIFDECFPYQSENELNAAIHSAFQKCVSYSGYTIKKELKNDIAFETVDGNIVKLSKKFISQAIQYSHINLNILYNPEDAEELALCLKKSPYEPLFAVLSAVNPETYSNYKELIEKYRLDEFFKAIEKEDIQCCKLFKDIIKTQNKELNSIAYKIFSTDNSSIKEWFLNTVTDNSCNLNSILYDSIINNDSNTVERIIQKKLFDATENPNSFRSPMKAALKNTTFIPLLLKNGFDLFSDEYFSTLSLDEIKAYLQYNVHYGKTVIDRILKEKRYDILNIIEKSVPKYCSDAILLSVYIDVNDFDRFQNIASVAHFSADRDSVEESLLERAFKRAPEWADLILQNGYDINYDNARLLHWAAEQLLSDFAIYLLEHGANPSLREKHDRSIFQKVAESRVYLNEEEQKAKEKFCLYLLDRNVDPIMESKSKPSIFAYLMNLSTEFKSYLIDWLGQHGRINDYECQNNSAISNHRIIYNLFDAYGNKFDSGILRQMLEYGAEVNVFEKSGDCLFVEACAVCGVEDLKLLINHGANINELDNINQTNGLYNAVRHNRPKDVIEFLISLGLDINSKKKEIRTATFGIFINEKIIPAQTVLDLAIENKKPDIIELLKNNGAKLAVELDAQ